MECKAPVNVFQREKLYGRHVQKILVRKKRDVDATITVDRFEQYAVERRLVDVGQILGHRLRNHVVRLVAGRDRLRNKIVELSEEQAALDNLCEIRLEIAQLLPAVRPLQTRKIQETEWSLDAEFDHRCDAPDCRPQFGQAGIRIPRAV